MKNSPPGIFDQAMAAAKAFLPGSKPKPTRDPVPPAKLLGAPAEPVSILIGPQWPRVEPVPQMPNLTDLPGTLLGGREIASKRRQFNDLASNTSHLKISAETNLGNSLVNTDKAYVKTGPPHLSAVVHGGAPNGFGAWESAVMIKHLSACLDMNNPEIKQQLMIRGLLPDTLEHRLELMSLLESAEVSGPVAWAMKQDRPYVGNSYAGMIVSSDGQMLSFHKGFAVNGVIRNGRIVFINSFLDNPGMLVQETVQLEPGDTLVSMDPGTAQALHSTIPVGTPQEMRVVFERCLRRYTPEVGENPTFVISQYKPGEVKSSRPALSPSGPQLTWIPEMVHALPPPLPTPGVSNDQNEHTDSTNFPPLFVSVGPVLPPIPPPTPAPSPERTKKDEARARLVATMAAFGPEFDKLQRAGEVDAANATLFQIWEIEDQIALLDGKPKPVRKAEEVIPVQQSYWREEIKSIDQRLRDAHQRYQTAVLEREWMKAYKVVQVLHHQELAVSTFSISLACSEGRFEDIKASNGIIEIQRGDTKERLKVLQVYPPDDVDTPNMVVMEAVDADGKPLKPAKKQALSKEQWQKKLTTGTEIGLDEAEYPIAVSEIQDLLNRASLAAETVRMRMAVGKFEEHLAAGKLDDHSNKPLYSELVRLLKLRKTEIPDAAHIEAFLTWVDQIQNVQKKIQVLSGKRTP